jgi:CheY-like chemotaxis protein
MTTRRPLRIVVLDDNRPVLRLVCGWFEREGHTCISASLSDFPGPIHEALPRFLAEHAPEVIVFDVGKPYGASWDLFDILRQLRETRPYPIVPTTHDKAALDAEIRTDSGALEIRGTEDGFPPLLAAVEGAVLSEGAQGQQVEVKREAAPPSDDAA